MSLRRQLLAQLCAAVRAGEIKPGSRLPGDRQLAAHFGVHRNTVAAVYADMDRLALVRRRSRSGTYVGSSPPRRLRDSSGDDLDHSFAAWVKAQRALGTTAAELDRLLTRWSPRSAEPRVAVIEPEAGLRRLIVAEISGALPNVIVTGWAPAHLCRNDARGYCLVARPEVAARLRAPDPALTDVAVIRTARAGPIRRTVGSLGAGEVVVFLTVSRCLRAHARELLASVLRARIGLATPDPESQSDVARAVRVADLVLADSLCATSLRKGSEARSRAFGPRLTVVSVAGGGWLRSLARYLGFTAANGALRNLKGHQA